MTLFYHQANTMIREHLFHKRAAADPLFRWRGGQVSRIGAFSATFFGSMV
ncbi:MAG: hypothetical protein QM477_05800 [Planctomycetota bacterium]